MALVHAFVRSRDQDAFARIVRRHVDMVYATALRRVRGDRHLAEDVTQATFIILASRAHSMDDRTLVAGWLHRAAGYAARNAMKMEARRTRHERRAAENAMTAMPIGSTRHEDDRWAEVEPLLDAAVDQLAEADRAAVVMRFHQDKPVGEIAAALGVSPEAAKKRLQRAIEKLRSVLAHKGVRLPTASALATTIASHASAVTAPAALADRAAAAAVEAVASTAAVGAPLLIAKGVLTMMLWTKIKLAALVAAVAIMLAGAGAMAVSMSSSTNKFANTSKPPPRFVFGEVVERVVNDDGLRKDETIDFDTGKLHTGPARSFASREEGRAWFRSTGADAHGETEEGQTGLFAMEMAVTPLDEEQWDADPDALRDQILDAKGDVPLMSGDGDLPRTYLFRTREGGVGVCQILEVTRDAEQHGTIRVRFKLIKPAQ